MDVAQSAVMAEDENEVENAQKDVRDIGKDDNTSISDSEEDLRAASENLRQAEKNDGRKEISWYYTRQHYKTWNYSWW